VVALGGTGFPGRSLVVDMGMYKTGMMLVQDGEILTSTSLYFGVRGLEMIVEKMFGLSVSNAQTIVREQGIIDTPENERVSEVLLTAVSVIVAEIEKLHMEWMLEYSGEKVDAIVLLGEGALVNGFADYLGLKIRVPVMRADTWAGTTVRNDDTVPAMSYRDSLTYAVVIGLAQNAFLI
jgi:Tfp pilus assembly PilM family ATPase